MSDFRVGIDCRSLGSGPPGIATYVKNLLAHIPNLECVCKRWPPGNFLWNQLMPPAYQAIRGWPVFHAPAYVSPLVNFSRVVLTVHDVSHLVHPQWYPGRHDQWRHWYYRTSLRRAARIIVPSDFSRSELLRFMPSLRDRVRRIHQGVSQDFCKSPELARMAQLELNLPKKFLLHVGDIHTRRNPGLLMQLAQALEVPLVVVGRTLEGGEAFEKWPHRYSGLTQKQLQGVYSAASVFVYASVYEGFGLPLLEAMACGLPVVAFKAASIPEVCGDAALLTDGSPQEFTEAVRRVLRNPSPFVERGLHRAKLFSWKSTAKQTLEVYRELGKESAQDSNAGEYQ
ncbi:MAG: glycosyltransferase family 4 protein [Acidobacteria bacterium]|nr:glycosyltransferase family 4 protein [Acidobacteriota bacterium]